MKPRKLVLRLFVTNGLVRAPLPLRVGPNHLVTSGHRGIVSMAVRAPTSTTQPRKALVFQGRQVQLLIRARVRAKAEAKVKARIVRLVLRRNPKGRDGGGTVWTQSARCPLLTYAYLLRLTSRVLSTVDSDNKLLRLVLPQPSWANMFTVGGVLIRT